MTGPTNGRSASHDRFDAWPQSAAQEGAVLGGIITYGNELLDQLKDLEVDDFFDLKHKIVFGAIRALETAGKPFDVVTVEAEIERHGKLDAIGGVAFLGGLLAARWLPENVLQYAEQMKADSRNRKALVLIGSALERAKKWPHSAAELVSELAGELQRLEIDHPITSDDRVGKSRWLLPMLDFLGDEEPTDDDSVDWIIRDLVPRGEPVIWGGPMKAGKTWGVMDVALAVALGQSWIGRFENTLGEPAPTMGLFLEDNKRRISKRLHELARGHGRDLLRDPILRSHLYLSRSPLRLPDAKDQRALIKEIKRGGIRLVIVDNLTRVILGDPNSTRDAANFTRAWVEIGDETGATILFLHHTRKPPSSGDKEVDPFDQLRGSADFGAAARNMVVVMPMRIDGKLAAEVRMRGNLDLRCDSFALGFWRDRDEGWNGAHVAKLLDLGEVTKVKDEAKKERKEKKTAEKKAEKAAEFVRRREHVITLLHAKGAATLGAAARAFGLSDNAMKPVFDSLIEDGIAKKDGKRGFVLIDTHEDPQGGLGL